MNRRQVSIAALTAGFLPSAALAQTPGSSDSQTELLRMYVEEVQAQGNVAILDEIGHTEMYSPEDTRSVPGREAYKQSALDAYYWRQDNAHESEFVFHSAISSGEIVAGLAYWSGIIGTNLPAFKVPYYYYLTVRDGLIYEYRAASDITTYDESLMGSLPSSLFL